MVRLFFYSSELLYSMGTTTIASIIHECHRNVLYTKRKKKNFFIPAPHSNQRGLEHSDEIAESGRDLWHLPTLIVQIQELASTRSPYSPIVFFRVLILVCTI
jgi:hypothetical protein